jgi:hypothetical protein
VVRVGTGLLLQRHVRPMRNLQFLLVAAVLPLFAASAAAQPSTPPRTPALVALSPDLLGADTPFRLARFGGNSPGDVILLAPDADASVLTQAVEALMVVRRQSGDHGPGVNATFRARRAQQRPRVLPWAARVLRDVHSAAPREVPGVGWIPAVQIWLPAQRGVGGVGRSGNP